MLPYIREVLQTERTTSLLFLSVTLANSSSVPRHGLAARPTSSSFFNSALANSSATHKTSWTAAMTTSLSLFSSAPANLSVRQFCPTAARTISSSFFQLGAGETERHAALVDRCEGKRPPLSLSSLASAKLSAMPSCWAADRTTSFLVS